jgi:GlcNAc-P-P-Und epimerase
VNRILVTGSAGFIGGHVCKALIDAGYHVLGLDLEPAVIEHAAYIHRICDIRDSEALITAFREFGPVAVIHLAARTDLDGQSVSDYDSNTVGTTNVLSALRATTLTSRLICTSSQLVCKIGYTPSHDRDFAPDTAYGESKVLTEQICRSEDGGGAEWCIVRPTTIWGPRMNPHYLRFFKLIRRGLYFQIGSEPRFKSYGYVGNTAHQFLQLLTAPAASIHRKVFYLADYEPLDLNAWASAFARELGAPAIRRLPRAVATIGARVGDLFVKLGFVSWPFHSRRLRNVMTAYQFDLGETRKVCGPLPFHVQDGVRQTARWVEGVL